MTIINIANSILILGVIYLHLVYGLGGIPATLMVLWGFAFWLTYRGATEKTNLIKSEIRLNNAKAKWFETKAEEKEN